MDFVIKNVQISFFTNNSKQFMVELSGSGAQWVSKTSRQTCEKLQCLNENLMSNNFRKTAVVKKKK